MFRIRQMQEAGLIQYWSQKIDVKNNVKLFQAVKPEKDSLDLHKTRSIFAILLIGLPIAIICFTLETITFLKINSSSRLAPSV